MFSHAHGSLFGWLKPGPIYVKRNVRNKHEPLVDIVELIEFNPNYAYVHMQDGRETFVSKRDFFTHQSQNNNQIELDNSVKNIMPKSEFEDNFNTTEFANYSDSDMKQPDDSVLQDNETLRRCTRVCKINGTVLYL